MGPKLVNVRLDEARLRKARRLRANGIALSDVVREAIDARYDAMTTAETVGPEAAARVLSILDAHPDSSDQAARMYDVHDAAAARKAIRTTLTRRTRDPR